MCGAIWCCYLVEASTWTQMCSVLLLSASGRQLSTAASLQDCCWAWSQSRSAAGARLRWLHCAARLAPASFPSACMPAGVAAALLEAAKPACM